MSYANLLRQLTAEVVGDKAGFSLNVNIALKIRSELSDPDCHVDEAVRLVQTEPVLAAQAVAMANSVIYNPAGREIADVRSAVSRLGFQVLRTLAASLVVRQMAGMARSASGQSLASRLWEHTTQIAALARVIARDVTGQNPESAVFAALVHDLGSFYLLGRIEDANEPLGNAFDRDETAALAMLTLTMLESMAMPVSVIEAVREYWLASTQDSTTSIGGTLRLAVALSPTLHPFIASLQPDQATGVADETGIALRAEADNEVSQIRALLDDAEEEIRALIALMQY